MWRFAEVSEEEKLRRFLSTAPLFYALRIRMTGRGKLLAPAVNISMHVPPIRTCSNTM